MVRDDPRHIPNGELPFRRGLSHELAKDVFRYLVQTVFVPSRVNERHVRRVRPDLPHQRHVSGVNSRRVFADQVLDTVHVGLRAAVLAGNPERTCRGQDQKRQQDRPRE